MMPYEIMQLADQHARALERRGGRRVDANASRSVPSPRLAQSRAEDRWDYTASIGITRQLLADRMFRSRLEGLDRGIQALKR